MSLTGFTLWEFAIGGAAVLTLVLLTGLGLPVALLGLWLVAIAAAFGTKHYVAGGMTVLAAWLTLSMYAHLIPRADELPQLRLVIEDAATAAALESESIEP